jgi:hypothetical protein
MVGTIREGIGIVELGYHKPDPNKKYKFPNPTQTSLIPSIQNSTNYS